MFLHRSGVVVPIKLVIIGCLPFRPPKMGVRSPVPTLGVRWAMKSERRAGCSIILPRAFSGLSFGTGPRNPNFRRWIGPSSRSPTNRKAHLSFRPQPMYWPGPLILARLIVVLAPGRRFRRQSVLLT